MTCQKDHKIIQCITAKKIKSGSKSFKTTTKYSLKSYKGVRDAKHAWLYPDDPLVRKVEQRTHLATGLNMMASEPLQVGRYGIGGHYKPHFDHDHTGTDDNSQGNF